MNFRVLGPIFFSVMLFVISGSIRLVTFTKAEVVFDLAPEIALWSVGILFSLAISERSLLAGRIEHVFKTDKEKGSLTIQYLPIPPDMLEFSPKFFYFFVYSMMIWILVIIVSEVSRSIYLTTPTSPDVLWLIALSSLLSSTTVGLSIRCLKEVV